MIERSLAADGRTWKVALAGRVTQYDQDEYTLIFEHTDEHGKRVRRASRFSPQGSRSRAAALAELSDADLAMLLRQSQPESTSPELSYGR